MSNFKSSDEFFQAVRDLATKVEKDGQKELAKEIREALGVLDGLTDGWADFTDALDQILRSRSKQLSEDDARALRDFHSVAKKAVSRS